MPQNHTSLRSLLGRRELLRLGLSGLSALSLPGLARLRAESAPAGSSRRTALILVWLPGGASHLETYDPKPNAPSEYRGPYASIATKASGIRLCELLPRHAEVANRFTILRSIVHTGFCHQQGTHQLLTGHPDVILKLKPDHPDFFSITNRLRYDSTRTVPNYIGIPAVNYSGSAYLGHAYEPFVVSGDPNSPNFRVPNMGLGDQKLVERLERRISLRQKFDVLRRELDQSGGMQAMDTFERQAWNLLSSPATQQAFDISQEHEKTRDRYGRNLWGQRCLLARRLVEAGVDLVTTQMDGALCGRVGNWDDHAVNHNVFEAMKYRTAFFDQAVAALIEDLYQRGLDERVMLVVGGEFGRTPKISYAASTGKGIGSADVGVTQPGRDHWPRATSLLFAGGGLTGGRIVGATDARGEDPVDRIVGRGDFVATMYRHLGIDPAGIAPRDFSGRPVPILPEGSPIPELVAGT